MPLNIVLSLPVRLVSIVMIAPRISLQCLVVVAKIGKCKCSLVAGFLSFRRYCLNIDGAPRFPFDAWGLILLLGKGRSSFVSVLVLLCGLFFSHVCVV